MKLVCFIGFPSLSYLVLFSLFRCAWFWLDIDVCLFEQDLFTINIINNLGLKFVNSINQGLNFPTKMIYEVLVFIFIYLFIYFRNKKYPIELNYYATPSLLWSWKMGVDWALVWLVQV